MRIGIITFHNTLNYGATLQCTAFSEYLSALGHDVRVIDYLPDYVLDKKSALKEIRKVGESKNKIKAVVKGAAYLLMSGPIRKKDRKFESFIKKNLNLTRAYHTYDEIMAEPPEADLFFCGSDQIWNPALTGGAPDQSFFLRFTEALKASYGVSLGEADVDSFAVQLREMTKDYLALSVREKSVREKISDVTGRDVPAVLDCTLLLDRERYAKMEESPDGTDRPYLLLYNVQSSKNSVEIAGKIAAEKQLRIIDISPNPFVKNKGIIKRLDIGPGEFLTLVRKADFIVTNSFHGAAFSIIYEKPFFSVTPAKRGSRIFDLLDTTGLKERLIQTKDEVFYRDIDYKKTKDLLNAAREDSIQYINAVIRKAEEKQEEN